MSTIVAGRRRRVLVIERDLDDGLPSPLGTLERGGTLIVLESDPARAASARQRIAEAALEANATVIHGDPQRLLYKFAGPFDAIFCSTARLTALETTLSRLLAADGLLDPHGR